MPAFVVWGSTAAVSFGVTLHEYFVDQVGSFTVYKVRHDAVLASLNIHFNDHKILRLKVSLDEVCDIDARSGVTARPSIK